MNILVSVIIPCFNSEKYISKCIESVFNQSYKNIEIICVDNNSTDDTIGVLKEWANKLIILKEIKPGAPSARNTGLSSAKGEWIQFLDADDMLLPDKISNQLNLLAGGDADFIIGNYCRLESNTAEKYIHSENNWENLIKGRLGFTSSNLWKKSSLISVAGWDDIESSQDNNLMFKLLKRNSKILRDNEFNTLKIDRRGNSISKTNVKENVIRYIELRIAIWDYLEESGQLTVYLLNILKINVFDSIRILYTKDKDAGIMIHNLYVKDRFKPIVSSSSSKLYLYFYDLIGFKMVQRFAN